MSSSPGFKITHGLGSLKTWGVLFAAVWLLHFLVIPNIEVYYVTILLYAGINVILALSLNLVNGFTGQFSMGHAGFMSVGGYVATVLTLWFRTQYPDYYAGDAVGGLVFLTLVALPVAGLVAGVAGYVVGLPSLRLRGDYLAIVTLGFGEIIRVVFLNMESVGGARGIPGIPQITQFGMVFAWVVVTGFVIWRMVKSPRGRELLAVREDEVAAEIMGVNTTKAKVSAFVMGAFFAGVAGGLFAHTLGFIEPKTFDYNRSFEIIIMVVLGGMGSLTGSVIAALFLTALPEALRPLQELTKTDFRMVIYSGLLILLMLTKPNGLFGMREFTAFLPNRLKKWFSHRGLETSQDMVPEGGAKS